MKHRLGCFYCIILLFSCCVSFGQDVSLLEQFNGRFDFTFVGNTLNNNENNLTDDCIINTTSSATLNLATGNEIEKAYLYWAGSGPGDFNVELNGIAITASRTFNLFRGTVPYFSAFADVTGLVESAGNGVYVFSGLDLNAVINTSVYCQNRTNFGGWTLVIVYKNPALPLNQLNVYDGLQGVPDEITITLDNLNVIDNTGAKIGFVAWEGDQDLDFGESLIINTTTLSNAINPYDNAFNGTNTITGATNLYNMDLDIYDIQNAIQIGATTATIQLKSERDFVMISTIVTKLNSQLPDAVIAVDAIEQECNSRRITVNYTVSNPDSTNPLPGGIPIAIYINDVYFQYAETLAGIPINGSQSDSISLDIPDTVPNNFVLKFVVDMRMQGSGIVTELHEDNNTYSIDVSLWTSPVFHTLPLLEGCNLGQGKGNFNFSSYAELVKADATDSVSFFNSPEDAGANTNPISSVSDYSNVRTPEEIFVRIQDSHNCFSITSFFLKVKNCPPKIYNLVAPKPDNYYDSFLIDGLRDIFVHFKLSIYNRWGALVWEGNNATPDWDGTAMKGVRIMGNELAEGTYYYILELNDPDYPDPMTGFVYLKRE